MPRFKALEERTRSTTFDFRRARDLHSENIFETSDESILKFSQFIGGFEWGMEQKVRDFAVFQDSGKGGRRL